jgi:hypothetical protein
MHMANQPYDELQALRADARDEIKRRIDQRDRYSNQLTIALGALFAVALAEPGLDKILLAAPLISIYFTVLILYSYRMHSVLAGYVTRLETELSRASGVPAELEWEHYYSRHAVPGIRRTFFLAALWVVALLVLLYLWTRYRTDSSFRDILFLASIVYGSACLLISATSRGKPPPQSP